MVATSKSSTSNPTNSWLVRLSKHSSILSTFVLSILTTTTTTKATSRASVHSSLWSALLVPYQKGDTVMYNGMKYQCIKSHRSYAGAEPSPLTWALWRKIE